MERSGKLLYIVLIFVNAKALYIFTSYFLIDRKNCYVDRRLSYNDTSIKQS